MDGTLPQPDFKRVARNFRDAANDFECCSNLPAVDGGARLMQMMETIMERLTEMDQKMRDMDQTMRTGFSDLNGRVGRLETKVDRLETKVDKLETKVDRLETKVDRLEIKVDGLETKVDSLDLKITTFNKNTMARIQNSAVIHENVDLAPLYDFRTGDLIPSCPRTLQALDRMSSQEVAELLRLLDESVPRAVDQRIRRLRDALGVRSRV